MRGKVSRAVFTGLLAGCMAVTPVGTAYAESIPAEISVETTAEESAETEDVFREHGSGGRSGDTGSGRTGGC